MRRVGRAEALRQATRSLGAVLVGGAPVTGTASKRRRKARQHATLTRTGRLLRAAARMREEAWRLDDEAMWAEMTALPARKDDNDSN